MTKAYSYVEHNLRNFYQTGFEKNNNISLRYGNEKVAWWHRMVIFRLMVSFRTTETSMRETPSRCVDT